MLKNGKSGYWKILPVNNRPALYFLPLLIIVSFIVYKDLLFADFLDYDDIGNVVQNLSIKNFSIKGIFTTSVYYSYIFQLKAFLLLLFIIPITPLRFYPMPWNTAYSG